MKTNSLALRLFATATVWMLIVLPIAGVIIYELYRDDVQATFDGRIEKLVNAIAVESMGAGPEGPVAPNNRYEPLFEDTHSGWYWQIKPLDDPTLPRLVSASLATAALPSPVEWGTDPDQHGSRWMNTTGPVGERVRIVEVIDSPNHAKDGPRYSVIVAGPIDWLENGLANFLARLTTALAIAGLGLATATILQVRFGLHPLRKIEKGLADVRSGRADKLEGDLPAEIEPLQHEVNALIASNQDIIDRARTQVGNLAHALKTPLAVITNEARDDTGPLGTKVAEQAEIMRDQVNHYLDRARVAARVGLGRSTKVHPVLTPLVRALERIHRDRGIQISVTCPDDAVFAGERQDLEEMLGNLCDNACKWANSHVYLTVTTLPADKIRAQPRLRISVEDDGPGLSEKQQAKIGKRGVRLDESKPGSGLGLSIVTDLARSYRGSMELARSSHGGLTVNLDLPAS